MPNKEMQRSGRTDGLSRRFEAPPAGKGPELAAPVALLVRARWVILLLLGVYALYATTFYSFGRFGFFLSLNQSAFLLLSLAFVSLYNLSYQNASRGLSRYRYADHLQVLLDTALVTVLVHFSGGAASWIWPLYLIVAIEAVYLLERRREIWFAWSASAFCYGALLACEHTGVVRVVRMPFVDPGLIDDRTYLMLIWFWVIILDAAVTAIGFHLMSVSRGEAREMRESEERLFAFLEHADDLIQMNAPDGRFIYANQAWLKGLGYRREDLAGLDLSLVVHPESLERYQDEFGRVLADREGRSLETVFLTRDGSPVDVEGNLSCSFRQGGPVAVWAVCRDVTKRKRADEQLYRMAHYDVLTELPNRLLFMDRLQQLRAMSFRMEQRMAVLFLDLDRFKNINDTLGHGVGDRLLQLVAQRLAGCVRGMDTVARLGGDEFVIALGNLRDPAGAEIVAGKVLKALSLPYSIDTHEFTVTCSIGISVYPDDGLESDELLKRADLALYGAKEQGRSCYRKYSEVAPSETDGAGAGGDAAFPVSEERRRGKEKPAG
jgi:diguanylate cyclase (GGDEF)-like protein/PAS domain S-box-containing protein